MAIFIPIETYSREFDSKLLLAYEIGKKINSQIIVGPKPIVNEIALNKSTYGDIYFTKDLSSLSFELICKLKKRKIIIVAIDEEGLVWHDTASYLSKRVSRDVINIVDFLIAWGEAQNQIISKYQPDMKNRIENLGNPRIDLTNLKYKNYNETNKNKILDKPYILINTVLSHANWNHKTYGTSSYLENMVKSGKITNNEEMLYQQNRVKYQIKLRDHIVDLISKLIEHTKDLHIVLRPHPDEDSDYWMNIFKNPRFTVRKDLTAIAWIQNSEAVIFSGCTTGIESYLSGKKTLWFAPLEDYSEFEPFLPNSLLPRIINPEKIIEQILNKKLIESEPKNNSLDYYISKLHGQNSSTSIANRITEKYGKSLITENINFWPINWIKNLSLFYLFQNSITYKLFNIPIKNKKFPKINKKFIRKKLRILRSINSDEIDFEISLISFNTYSIKIFQIHRNNSSKATVGGI